MRADVFDERRGAFAALRDRGVLVYWPHGFGDFVHFGYVAPLLEPSNRYRITRFGDDFVHLYDGQCTVQPLYSGVARPSDGPPRFRHLGINFKRIRNRAMEVAIPPPLSEGFFRADLDSVLYTDYPEYAGGTAFPYHTKARALASKLVAPGRLAAMDLLRPLQSALTFEAPADARHAIEARLAASFDPARPLVAIATGGHTNAAKAWPEEQAASLRCRLAARGAQTLTVNEATFATLFGTLDVPFAHAIVTVLRRADAFVGVAAGPLHAALAIGGRPIVGLWSRHYPDWYDEPCATALHFVAAGAIRDGLHRRAASLTKPASMKDRIVHADADVVSAADVDQALREAGV